MTFERRTIEPVPGRRVSVDLLVPPDLRSIDLDAPAGPRSAQMLERAHAALADWQPHDEQDEDARERARRVRELRRGERQLDGAGPLVEREDAELTSDVQDERIVAAEQLARELAADPPITGDGIAQLHMVIAGLPSPDAWRDHVVWMGDGRGPSDAAVHPASPERIASAMDELDRMLRSGGDPVIRGALVFAQIPAIHPWSDGNGRTGRVAADACLAAGLHPSGRGPRASDVLGARFDATRVGLEAWWRDGDLDSWLAMYAGAVVQAAANRPRSRGRWLRKRR
jgi:hypothetical protein